MNNKVKEPIERDGFCCGCQKFAKIFLVSPSRYRCIECCINRGDRWTRISTTHARKEDL